MRARTTLEQRAAFILRHQGGETLGEIAQAYGVSHSCVRYWWRRYQRHGGLQSHYHRQASGVLTRFAPVVRYVILRLRLAHPKWGPSRIHYHLQQRPSLRGIRLPSETQISRYLHQWPRFRRQRQRPAAVNAKASPLTSVHQCWQVDFKMGLALPDGTLVNLHTVHDPVGDVCITARVTPAGPVGKKPQRVSLTEVQQTLRSGFTRWQTLPDEVQTDNEALFAGNVSERFPSRFTLWLIGLGIRHHTIRPGKPTDNAEVERNHRTLNAYTLQGHKARTVAELQTLLDQACGELAFDLSSQAHTCAGRPPVVAHPELLLPRRPYQPAREAALFDLKRVDHFLAQFTWERTVTATGQISLGGQHHYYSVGRAYAHQRIFARFDPTDRHFIFPPRMNLGKPLPGVPLVISTQRTFSASTPCRNNCRLNSSFPKGKFLKSKRGLNHTTIYSKPHLQTTIPFQTVSKFSRPYGTRAGHAGVKARTRSGLPEPLTILSGAAMTTAPVAGN